MKEYLFAMLVLFFVSACKPNIGVDEFNSSGSKELAENIILNRTSGKTVTINDKDGFGLVNGNVVKLYLDKKRGIIVVEYIPFLNTGGVETGGIIALEMSTGKQATVTDYSLSDLKPIESFL